MMEKETGENSEITIDGALLQAGVTMLERKERTL
jgi:hypothetical protein